MEYGLEVKSLDIGQPRVKEFAHEYGFYLNEYYYWAVCGESETDTYCKLYGYIGEFSEKR